MGKSLLIRLLKIGFIAGIMLSEISAPINAVAEKEGPNDKFCPALEYKVVKTIKMIVTAYSSTPDQTDSTPFRTASGLDVRTLKEGERIVANNLLPFGTKVEIDGVVYTVADRMHRRKGTLMMDIHMLTREEAKAWGAPLKDIKVLKDVKVLNS